MSKLGFSLTDGRGIVRLDQPDKIRVNNGFVALGSRVFHNSEFSLPGQVVGFRGNRRLRHVDVRWTNGNEASYLPSELWKDTLTLVHRPGQVPFDRGTK